MCWLYTSSPAFAFHFRPSSQHPVLQNSPSHLLHASSRFRDITQGHGVAVRYIARWCGIVVCYFAWGCGVTLRYVARWSGVAMSYIARGSGVAVRYVARGYRIAGCCAVAGSLGYITIGVAQWGCRACYTSGINTHEGTGRATAGALLRSLPHNGTHLYGIAIEYVVSCTRYHPVHKCDP